MILTHIVSPEQFFVQKATDSIQLGLLSGKLNKAGRSKDALGRKPAAGEYLIGQYTADKNWYRCKVVRSVGEESYEVVYVDFGNREVLRAESLKPMRPAMAKIPVFALECALTTKDLKDGSKWEGEEVRNMFVKLFGLNA